MSHQSYENSVVSTATNLTQLLKTEDAKFNAELASDQQFGPPEVVRQKLVNTLGMRYVKYVRAYKTLDEARDQLVQPQKVQILSKLLNSIIGRIVEIKKALVEVTSQDYHFFDQLMLDNKLIPQDISLTVPRSENDPYLCKDSKLSVLRQKVEENAELKVNYN